MTSFTKLSRRFVLLVSLAVGLAACGSKSESAAAGAAVASATASGGGVTVDLLAPDNWGSGFNGAVRITNNSFGSAITSFQVVFKLNGGAGVQGTGWSGTITGPDGSGNYTLRSPTWMGSIAVGQSRQEGFGGTGAWSDGTIVSLQVNGQNIPLGGGDTTPPTVSLASSATNVTTEQTITLTATASDASGIARVEFLDGGALIGTDMTAPYTWSVALTAAQNGTHSYTARAVDASPAANAATSAAVAVVVNIGVVVGDFSIAADPAALDVDAGASVATTIAISRTNLPDAVAFAASGLPAGVTASFDPSPAAGDSTIVTFDTLPTTPSGTSQILITASAAGLSRTTAITLNVIGAQAGDFTISAAPSATVAQGASVQSTITISRTNLPDAIAFSAAGLPSGVSASFNPSSATGNSSVATFTASASATPGTYPVTVNATGGGVSRSLSISLTVTGTSGSFTLSAASTALSVNRSAFVRTTLSIARTNFTNSVTLSVSGLGSGVSASFNPRITTGTSSTVTFTASSTAPAGVRNITITGTGGGITRTVAITLTVNGGTLASIALAAAPTAVSVNAGGTGVASTITITRTNFTGAVALAATGLPAGVSAAFNPASATGTSSTVTFTATAAAVAGTSNVTITGTGTGVTAASVVIAVTVVGQTSTFTLAATSPVTVNRGSTATSTITITRTNFTSAIALTATGLPSGVSASFSPASATGTTSTLTFTASATATTGAATVTVTGTAGGISQTATIALTVSTTSTTGFAVVNGRITKNGQPFPVRCGSWFGLQGRYEPASDSANPRGAPMEQYVGNTFWASDHSRTVAQTMREIAQAGITVIRLPVVHQTLSGTDPQGNGQYYKNYSGIINDATYPMHNSKEAMESMIKAANAAGIAVMLDIHSCSNYIDWRKGRLDARPPWVDATRDNYDFKREDWSCASTLNPSTVRNTQPYNETIWLQDLRALAALPAQLGVTNIIGIDIFNEPWDYSWTEWKTLTEHAYQAISAVDPGLLLFVQGISASNGNQDGTPTTIAQTPHGDTFSNPNWGENLYPAGTDLPNVPISKLVWSPHTYGPSVAVQPMFADPAQPQCAGLEGDAFGDAKCQIVIDPTKLRPGWEEHFGYLKDLGYAIVVGEFGGNMDWPLGQASIRDRDRYAYLTDKTTDAKWQNAFVDYMVSRGIEGCYWSINPESGDTGGWYGHAYDPISNTGGWGAWLPFDSRKTTLLNRLWGR